MYGEGEPRGGGSGADAALLGAAAQRAERVRHARRGRHRVAARRGVEELLQRGGEAGRGGHVFAAAAGWLRLLGGGGVRRGGRVASVRGAVRVRVAEEWESIEPVSSVSALKIGEAPLCKWIRLGADTHCGTEMVTKTTTEK
jgi:hypothetical protein